MYSVVLMMAMTSGGDVADFGHRHGGCCGGQSYGCCGGQSYGCCGGYSGASYGCCGGESYGCGGGGRHHHHRHRGGCCGGSSYGCCGGSYGCCGGYSGASYGCCGGGYGGASYGCCGGGYGGASYGCGGGGYGNGAGCTGGQTTFDGRRSEAAPTAPATIIVSVPANAALTINETATASTASTRVFTSPALPAGEDFYYTLTARYTRNGRPVLISREVTVRAGEETNVDMQTGLTGVASR